MNRYTRVEVIPGKTYACGCDVQRYTALVPTAHYVNNAKCRVHDQPIARAPVVEACKGCTKVWCPCNRVKCDAGH